MRILFSCFLSISGLMTCLAVNAADSQGLFMVKGGGSASCAKFLDAQTQKNNEFVSFAGWLDGYLTHVNQTREKTFDMAPWQDTHLLLAAIGSWCKKNPQKTFHEAVFQMTSTLNSDRLQEKSPVVTTEHKGNSLVLYREILMRVQKNLNARGFLKQEPSGNFDRATKAALEDFQKSKNLPATGLPDQLTLANLL